MALLLSLSLSFTICGPGCWPPSQVVVQVPLEGTVKGEAEFILGDAPPLSPLHIFPSKQLTLKNKRVEQALSCPRLA